MSKSHDYDYDSAAVRAVARKIRNCANTVKQDARSRVRSMRSEVVSEFEGAAANALEDRLGDLGSDIASIANGLSGLSEALFDYADELEETARRLRAEMDD